MKDYTIINKTGFPGIHVDVVEGLTGKSIVLTRCTLGDVARGDVVRIDGVEYIVLDHGSETTALLANENVRYMQFGLTNNYARSNVRKFLRDAFEGKLAKAVEANNIVDRHLTIVAEDGTVYPEQCHERVGLLTADLYRRYRQLIKPLRSEWWLATPYAVMPKYHRLTQAIYSDGSMRNVDTATGSLGVRPFVVLNSSVTNFELVGD